MLKKIFICALLSPLFNDGVFAQTSQLVGNWSADCTWDPPPCSGPGSDVPNGGSPVSIVHAITLNANLTGGSAIAAVYTVGAGGSLNGTNNVTIGGAGTFNFNNGTNQIGPTTASGTLNVNSTLTIAGALSVSGTLNVATGVTLTVNGNATFSNGSFITLSPGSFLIVNGNLINNNNSTNVNINGSVTVNGNVDNGNGATITSSAGTGSIVASGSLINSGSGTIFGSTTDAVSGPVTTTAAAPLPITLVSLEARQDIKVVNVYWVTSSEINNDYFTVERSNDGNSFNAVFKTEGMGNSTENNSYQGTDFEPQNGINYYRLKQTDFDGKYTFSDVIKVNFEEQKTAVTKKVDLMVLPNPANGNSFNITIENAPIQDGTLIIIRDINGKEIISKMIEGHLVKGSDLVDEIAPGVYMITASNDDKLVHKKVVIH